MPRQSVNGFSGIFALVSGKCNKSHVTNGKEVSGSTTYYLLEGIPFIVELDFCFSASLPPSLSRPGEVHFNF